MLTSRCLLSPDARLSPALFLLYLPAHRPACISPGDGDPPDNSAAAFVALKKSWPKDHLAGVKFSVLGLGDSNYTRFMYVPRAIKNRYVLLVGW